MRTGMVNFRPYQQSMPQNANVLRLSLLRSPTSAGPLSQPRSSSFHLFAIHPWRDKLLIF